MVTSGSLTPACPLQFAGWWKKIWHCRWLSYGKTENVPIAMWISVWFPEGFAMWNIPPLLFAMFSTHVDTGDGPMLRWCSFWLIDDGIGIWWWMMNHTELAMVEIWYLLFVGKSWGKTCKSCEISQAHSVRLPQLLLLAINLGRIMVEIMVNHRNQWKDWVFQT